MKGYRRIIGPLFLMALGWTPAACGQTAGEAEEIRATIEQLVMADKDAPEPEEIIRRLKTGEMTVEESMPPPHPNLVEANHEAYRKRYKACQEAFKKLSSYKKSAFRIMVEHFGDKRQSIAFENHNLVQSVGAACRYNISRQLEDHPGDYSFYGYSRKGRDGKSYEKPYYGGSPFDEAGGLEAWLKANEALSYPEMQVKCLEWLLAKEKAIGVPDAESYFESILPLEIQILKRKQETGAEVGTDLKRLETALKKKDVKVIPEAMLPSLK